LLEHLDQVGDEADDIGELAATSWAASPELPTEAHVPASAALTASAMAS
jgi:hypothetical protein